MKKYYSILTIVCAIAMLPSCDDSNAIDSKQKPELYTLIFGTSDKANQQDEEKNNTPTPRINVDPTDGLNFTWSDNDKLVVVDMENDDKTDFTLYHMTIKEYNPKNVAFLGALPVYGLKEEYGSEGIVNVYAYVPPYNDDISPDPNNKEHLNINYPSVRTFKNDLTDTLYHNYGKELPFASAPINNKREGNITWNNGASAVPGASSIFIFAPLFTTINLTIYPDETARNKENFYFHSIKASVILNDNNAYDTSLKLDMNKFNNIGTTAERIAKASINVGKNNSNTMSTVIDYYNEVNVISEYEFSDIYDNNTDYPNFIIPIFTPRTINKVSSFEVLIEYFDISGILLAKTKRAVRVAPHVQSIWDFGETVNIEISEWKNAHWYFY